MAYYPGVDRSVTGTNAGPYTGGPAKTVLHTTEGFLASGAISAFKTTGSWPHFLVDFSGHIWQFIDTSLAAKALVNAPGGAETNKDHAVQIEIVGFAGQPSNHPVVQWDALRTLMRWIEATEGVKPIGPGRPFATAYGQNNLRFTSADWDNFAGICGHCHVPEGNDHWDPGAIDINSLLPQIKVIPMYVPALTLEPIVADLACPTGGAWLLAASGAVYAMGTAPYLGAPNGKDYFIGRKAAQLRLVDGKYAVITESNEVYGPGF